MLRKKSWLMVLIVLGAFSLGYTQDLQKKGRYWVGRIEKTFKVQAGGSLEMKHVRGDVIIRVWDKGEVSILETKRMDIFSENEAKRAMDESEIGYVQSGSTIRISGPAFNRSWIQSIFEITVPSSFSCDIETQGGDLKISGMNGRVDATSGGGDVRLADIGGVVNVKTGGGDIDIERTTKKVTAKTGGGDVTVVDVEGFVKVSTGGGDIVVENSQDVVKVITGGGDIDVSGVKGSLDVKTGGGDIDLDGVEGAIEVITGGGDVTVEMTLQDFSVDHHVTIKTGDGNIDLNIPAKLPATILAEIKIRRSSWEDYEIISDYPLKTTTKNEGSRYRIVRAEGDINGGGDLIRLNSGGGNIYIRKLR